MKALKKVLAIAVMVAVVLAIAVIPASAIADTKLEYFFDGAYGGNGLLTVNNDGFSASFKVTLEIPSESVPNPTCEIDGDFYFTLYGESFELPVYGYGMWENGSMSCGDSWSGTGISALHATCNYYINGAYMGSLKNP